MRMPRQAHDDQQTLCLKGYTLEARGARCIQPLQPHLVNPCFGHSIGNSTAHVDGADQCRQWRALVAEVLVREVNWLLPHILPGQAILLAGHILVFRVFQQRIQYLDLHHAHTCLSTWLDRPLAGLTTCFPVVLP